MDPACTGEAPISSVTSGWLTVRSHLFGDSIETREVQNNFKLIKADLDVCPAIPDDHHDDDITSLCPIPRIAPSLQVVLG